MSRVGNSLSAILLVAILAAACGDAASRDRAFTEAVAADFKKDCESSGGPGGAMRAHLIRLCACGEAKILATPIEFGEPDESIGAKVRTASRTCLDELGGAPGEKSR